MPEINAEYELLMAGLAAEENPTAANLHRSRVLRALSAAINHLDEAIGAIDNGDQFVDVEADLGMLNQWWHDFAGYMAALKSRIATEFIEEVL